MDSFQLNNGFELYTDKVNWQTGLGKGSTEQRQQIEYISHSWPSLQTII